MSALNLRVLISGAGIAGPCLAYWLSRTQLRTTITIVERSSVPRITGQAIDFEGAAVEIIEKMGLLEAVRACSPGEEGTRFLSASGKPFAQFDDNTFNAEYEILRSDLSKLFLEATKDLSNVEYVYGDSIKSLEQTDEEVKVRFSGGSEGNFDLVVGADGSTSNTRSLILDEAIVQDSCKLLGQYNAFFSIPNLPTDPKVWQWYNVPRGLGIMIRPHPTRATMGAYLSITMPEHGQKDLAVEEAMNIGPEATKQILRKYFANVGWEAERVLAGMDQADDFYMSRATEVTLSKWTSGRALVLGDAAWVSFGVGTTLAIEGAYVLAGELSKIQSSDEVPQALQRYEEVFRPLVEKMTGRLPGFPQILWPYTAWGLWMRDSLLWFVSKTKIFKLFRGGKPVIHELPKYPWSGNHKREHL